MSESSSYSHAFSLDKPVRLANDNIFMHIPKSEYKPVIPPSGDFFLLLDGTDFLLLDGTDFLLLG